GRGLVGPQSGALPPYDVPSRHSTIARLRARLDGVENSALSGGENAGRHASDDAAPAPATQPETQRLTPAAPPAPAAAGQADRASPTPAGRTPRRFGAYEIIRRLSQGGQGVVYLARQLGTRRDVALKVLPAQHAGTEGHVARFRREAQAAGRLNHPNIVTVYDTGMVEKWHYIAFEFVDGPPLHKLLAQQVPLYEAQIVEIALAVARALQHAHCHGVLHRDVKPANILLIRAGEVKLTDFGLARYDETHASFQT